MGRYNNGIIFTNENCIGCNKCINNCSLMGANVSILKNGIAHMEINEKKCNDCGRCINVCIHNARDFRDDVDCFLEDLKKGEKISLILEEKYYSLFTYELPIVVTIFKVKHVLSCIVVN